MHAAVASLHAVAADLAERAEAVDAELAALAEREADAHERAAAPLERRRDRIARLVEDVERSLRRAAAADLDDRSAALRVISEEAARARDERDAIARDTESSRRNDAAKHEARSAPSPVRRGRPPVARGFAFSPPASPPRRRATSSDARMSTERVKSSADVNINPPWDGRTALDTSRDDEARARRDRSRSKSPTRETASRVDVSAARKVSAGDVPWYAGAIPPRTTFPPPPPAERAERAGRERERERDPDGRVPSPAPAPDFAAALWPDFSAYGYCGGAAGMRPGDASSRVEALRGGYQTALLEMQRARAAEREAAAAAAEAAARELELQRAQLAAIASRLAKAAGVPSAPRAWGGSISRAADAAAFAAEAERSEAAPGPAFAAAAAAAERERRNRATRRAREHDMRVEEEAETSLRASRGASSGSLVSAMADLAEVARVTRERMEGLEVDATKKETEGSAREAVATAARHAAAAAAASAAGGSPAVVATALAEMAAALRRAERAAAGVDASAARGEARAARAESMLERTADALEEEARGSDAEFGRILDELRVARDRVESDDDERGAESGTLHAHGPGVFDEDAFILSEILRKADAEARSDAEAAAAAAAIRGSLEARGETFSPQVSATSPRRPARRRQLGDRVPPDPRRPSSLEFKGPARFGAKRFSRDEDETPAEERETYEVIGPASFSVNRFGTLVAAGPE